MVMKDAYLEPQGIYLADVLMVTITSTILGLFLTCLYVNQMGKELKDDPEYQRHLNDPKYEDAFSVAHQTRNRRSAKQLKFLFLYSHLELYLLC